MREAFKAVNNGFVFAGVFQKAADKWLQRASADGRQCLIEPRPLASGIRESVVQVNAIIGDTKLSQSAALVGGVLAVG